MGDASDGASYNGYCDYLGWPCDDDWMERAITGWEKLADSGDGNAMYALLRWRKSWWKYIPILNKNKNGELAELAVKSGGYKAASFNVGIPLDIEKRIELLKYAASKNYAPAMLYLYSASEKYTDIDVDIDKVDLLKKALFLGFGGELIFYYERMVPEIKNASDLNHLSLKEHKLLANLYYYSLINQAITGELDFKSFKWVYDEQREGVRIELFSPEEKKKIEKKAKQFLVDFKPNLFLDEASSVHALFGS